MKKAALLLIFLLCAVTLPGQSRVTVFEPVLYLNFTSVDTPVISEVDLAQYLALARSLKFREFVNEEKDIGDFEVTSDAETMSIDFSGKNTETEAYLGDKFCEYNLVLRIDILLKRIEDTQKQLDEMTSNADGFTTELLKRHINMCKVLIGQSTSGLRITTP